METRKRSKLQEKRIAKDIDGKVQKASGATDFAKGDVKTNDLYIEAKTTSKKSYSLKAKEITKIQQEAMMANAREWAMQIEFQGQAGMSSKVAVVDWYTYIWMRDELELCNAAHTGDLDK
jgi:hypothetical protein